MTYADQSIEGFLSAVASTRVAPSAGAVAAFTGALGASLCEMVCLHTSEAARADRLTVAEATLRDRRQLLLTLADEDGAAVDEVQTAFEQSSDDDHERQALRSATEIPTCIAEAARDVAEQAVVVAEEGTPNARIDAIVGATLARSAVTAAAIIVRANLDLLADHEFANDVRDRIDTADTDARAAVDAVTGRGA